MTPSVMPEKTCAIEGKKEEAGRALMSLRRDVESNDLVYDATGGEHVGGLAEKTEGDTRDGKTGEEVSCLAGTDIAPNLVANPDFKVELGLHPASNLLRESLVWTVGMAAIYVFSKAAFSAQVVRQVAV